MAYIITENRLGQTHIDSVDDSAIVPVGTIVRAVDPTYGEGEFVYLLGVVNTIVGSIVTWHDADTSLGLTALSTTVVDSGEPLAVAMAATVAGKYGWYQISGIAVLGKANSLSMAPGLDFAVAAGLVIAAATTNRVRGANTAITASASALVITIPCLINRPSGPGVG